MVCHDYIDKSLLCHCLEVLDGVDLRECLEVPKDAFLVGGVTYETRFCAVIDLIRLRLDNSYSDFTKLNFNLNITRNSSRLIFNLS